MNEKMTCLTQRDEIFFDVAATVAPTFLVMNLEVAAGCLQFWQRSRSRVRGFASAAAPVGLHIEFDARGCLGRMSVMMPCRPSLFKECLPLWSWQELEQPCHRLQRKFWVTVVQIRSCQEICTNHLEAVPPGFVRAEHQGCRF